MGPSAVICSVGKKPSTDASDEYRSHGAAVFSTRFHGTITMTMWGDGEVWLDDRDGTRIGRLARSGDGGPGCRRPLASRSPGRSTTCRRSVRS